MERGALAGTDAFEQSRRDRKRVEMLFAHSPRAFYCQRTGQVVALRQRMQGLARNVFLGSGVHSNAGANLGAD